MEKASLIHVSAHHWCLSSRAPAKHFRIAPVELFTQKPWCTRGFLQQLKFKHVLKCLVEQDSLFFPKVYVRFPGNSVVYFAFFISWWILLQSSGGCVVEFKKSCPIICEMLGFFTEWISSLQEYINFRFSRTDTMSVTCGSITCYCLWCHKDNPDENAAQTQHYTDQLTGKRRWFYVLG